MHCISIDQQGFEVFEKSPWSSCTNWQLCDGPAERPATTEGLIHAAREERMFPGEGGLDLVRLTKEMQQHHDQYRGPYGRTGETVNAETRARRALRGAKAMVAAASAAT